jgi:hypothetical protein
MIQGMPQMSIVAAREAITSAALKIKQVSDYPIVTEKRDPVTCEYSSETGWRDYLARSGVEAAIVRCTLRGAEGGRHVFFIGLEDAKEDPQLSEGLLAFAERCWQANTQASFYTFPIADAASHGVAAMSAIGGSALKRVLGQFGHAGVLHATSGADGISALLLRRTSVGPFCDLTQRRLLEVFPLFQEAAMAQVRSIRNERRAALLAAMFDQVSLATLLIGATGRPLFVNAAAQMMLDSRRFVFQSADGTLTCSDSAQSKLLRAAIRTATTVVEEPVDEISMRIGQAEGDWRLAVIVPASTRVGDQQMRCAMVMIHKPQRCNAPSHVLKALGLLPSEQRFLQSFLGTNSIAEAAERSGLSEETARTYLKRVRCKLGVHRQLELARLVYGLVPAIRTSQSLVEG